MEHNIYTPQLFLFVYFFHTVFLAWSYKKLHKVAGTDDINLEVILHLCDSWLHQEIKSGNCFTVKNCVNLNF